MDFGIISLGNHAINRIIPAIEKSGSRIVSIYSTSREKGLNFSKKFGAEYYDDIGKMMKSRAEAVYISSPNFLHYSHAKSALENGKWVLLEKPMTLNLEQSKELHRISERNHIPLCMGFHLRFQPSVDRIKEIINAGKIGLIRNIYGQWSHYSSHDLTNSWWGNDIMAGGGSIVGTGVHVMDTLVNIVSSVPVGLSGMNEPRGKVIEDQFNILLQFVRGTMGFVLSSRKIPEGHNDLIIQGELDSVTVKNFFSTKVDSELLFQNESRKYQGIDMYEMEIRDFKGKRERIANSWDGVISTALHLGAQMSAREGKFITLQEILGT